MRALAAMAVRDRGGEAEQHERRGHGHDAGHVARGDGVRTDVLDVHGAVDQAERAQQPRGRRPEAGPQGGERRDRRAAGDQRDERGDHVLPGAEPRLPVHERVVEGVHEEHDRRDGEHAPLGHRARLRSKKPTTRRSYSSGRASMPPVCPDSGISQSSLGSFAAAW